MMAQSHSLTLQICWPVSLKLYVWYKGWGEDHSQTVSVVCHFDVDAGGELVDLDRCQICTNSQTWANTLWVKQKVNRFEVVTEYDCTIILSIKHNAVACRPPFANIPKSWLPREQESNISLCTLTGADCKIAPWMINQYFKMIAAPFGDDTYIAD